MFTEAQRLVFQKVQAQATRLHLRAFVAGGVVRDILRSCTLSEKDLDFVIEGNAITFAQELHTHFPGNLKTFPNFFTAKLETHDAEIRELDFASAREETYTSPGSLPTVSISSIERDLQRRDFTINAMAIPVQALLEWNSTSESSLIDLRSKVIDSFGGVADLENAIIRILHSNSFIDDPTRMFRAFRYAARISGTVEKETSRLMQEALNKGALESISKYRVVTEIRKIFSEANPFQALAMAAKAGLTKRCGIYDFNLETEILAAIERISALPRNSDPEYKWELALRIFYSMGPRELAQERLKTFGFGKKKFSKMDAEVEAIKSVTDNDRAGQNLFLLDLKKVLPINIFTEK